MNDYLSATALYLANLNAHKPGAPTVKINIDKYSRSLAWNIYNNNPDCCLERHTLILNEQHIKHHVIKYSERGSFGNMKPIKSVVTEYDWNDPELLNKLNNLISNHY
jgi:hypothetical protein